MLRSNKALWPALYKTILFFVLIFSVLPCRSQGLLFNSNDSLLTRRTSLHVFSSDIPEFQDHLSISFDLSLWDNAHLGYVLNLADKDNSYSLSYLYMNGQGFLNFNIDRKSNKIQIPLDASMLKRGKWMKVKIDLDLKNDRVDLYVNDHVYKADQLGLKEEMPGNLTFGKNQFYTEVPNMAIKNLSVSDDSKSYEFPLDEWKGYVVHDKEGDVTGMVENPVWLINESYFWKPAYTRSFREVAGLNFNTNTQNLFIFAKDSLISFDPELKQTTTVPYKNKLPVPMVLGKSIFNARENKCYIYELFDIPKGMYSVAALDMSSGNPVWDAIGKTILPQQRHHHNMFYNLQQDSIYLFGGYGAYSYYNKFLKYDPSKDQWETVPFKGDNITPRFFAATGSSDDNNEIFLFGGYGNESGNQIVGGKQFYDLYRINLRTHVITKCWNIHPAGKEVFVPANNLILSPDKKYFYALCYPHEVARTALRLYKFSIKDGSYEVVSAPIPVISERIESDINLFFNHKTNTFYCTVQEFSDRANSVIKIYSLLAPPVSSTVYQAALNPPQKSPRILIYVGAGIAVLALLTGLLYVYKRRASSSATSASEIEKNPTISTEREIVQKKRNVVYLLGEFLVLDKNGRDITYLFSPKIKQLFLLILLNSKGGSGITSKKISLTLWPDKDVAKTKNIKGVTFNHLRNIISDLDGIELTFLNDNYLFQIEPGFFCDYFCVSDMLGGGNDKRGQLIHEHLSLISRGTFLGDMTDQWLDYFKNDYEESLVNALVPQLKPLYDENDLKVLLDLTRVILDTDPFNDTALKYLLKGQRKLKGVEHARKVYDQFIAEYKRSFGTDYPAGFEKTIQ